MEGKEMMANWFKSGKAWAVTLHVDDEYFHTVFVGHKKVMYQTWNFTDSRKFENKYFK